MPASFLRRHRTVCSVLYEIQSLADERGDEKTHELCQEALLYVRRMSIKLTEYKREKDKRDGTKR